MKKFMIVMVAAFAAMATLAGPPHGGPGGWGGPGGHHGGHHGGGFAAGVVGGALLGGLIYDAVRPAPVVVTPAPVVVQQPAPVIVQQPAPVVVQQPVYQTQNVWVEGRYVEQVQPNGVVMRVWQPGHYEQRQVQVY